MTKGTPLTVEEQSAILAFHKAKMPMQLIKEVNRSYLAVWTVIMQGEVRRRGARSGPPPELTTTNRRLLVRKARRAYILRESCVITMRST